MSDFTIQHVQTKQQLEDTFTIRTIVFVEEQQVPPEEEVDEYEDQCEHVIVYDEQQVPVGAGRLRKLSDSEAKVERICVHNKYRKTGLGARIMNKIEDIGRSEQLHVLVLNAQQHAAGFYEKLGYSVISDEPFEEAGIMHVKMKKEL